jgi:ATP-dependent Zn protease
MGDSLVAYDGASRVGLRAQDSLDRQVEELVAAAHARALAALRERSDVLTRLTDALLAHDALDGDAVRALVAAS